MKLGTLRYADCDRLVAVLDSDHCVDLFAGSNGASYFRDMLSMIKGGAIALDTARRIVSDPPDDAIIALRHTEHCIPFMPVQYRDCLVFEQHLLNGFAQAEKMTGRPYAIPDVWYDQPIYYKGNRFSFIGHGQDVIWPSYSNHLDLELELAIVIGKEGAYISKADAPDHIFGYTILNDVSARDAQMDEMAGQLGPAKGKDFDTGNIIGPWIVTTEDMPHPVALDMEVRVNDVRWGGGNSRDMHHNFADVISHISAAETLHPGELIGSGTVGTGCGLEIGKRLADGDKMALSVEGIGTLQNTIRKK